jgi:hypothetical protein
LRSLPVASSLAAPSPAAPGEQIRCISLSPSAICSGAPAHDPAMAARREPSMDRS